MSPIYVTTIGDILPKGPYLPCVSMAGRALLAGYPRYVTCWSNIFLIFFPHFDVFQTIWNRFCKMFFFTLGPGWGDIIWIWNDILHISPCGVSHLATRVNAPSMLSTSLDHAAIQNEKASHCNCVLDGWYYMISFMYTHICISTLTFSGEFPYLATRLDTRVS